MSDDEGGLIGGALVVRDGVVDGDIEGLVLLEGLVGGVGWIEGPIASGGVDGETVDGSADERAQNSAEIRSLAVSWPLTVVASSVAL